MSNTNPTFDDQSLITRLHANNSYVSKTSATIDNDLTVTRLGQSIRIIPYFNANTSTPANSANAVSITFPGSSLNATLHVNGNLTAISLSLTNGATLGNGNDISRARSNFNVDNVLRVGYNDGTHVGTGLSNNARIDCNGVCRAQAFVTSGGGTIGGNIFVPNAADIVITITPNSNSDNVIISSITLTDGTWIIQAQCYLGIIANNGTNTNKFSIEVKANEIGL